jgi:hypothetical protein
MLKQIYLVKLFLGLLEFLIYAIFHINYSGRQLTPVRLADPAGRSVIIFFGKLSDPGAGRKPPDPSSSGAAPRAGRS